VALPCGSIEAAPCLPRLPRCHALELGGRREIVFMSLIMAPGRAAQEHRPRRWPLGLAASCDWRPSTLRFRHHRGGRSRSDVACASTRNSRRPGTPWTSSVASRPAHYHSASPNAGACTCTHAHPAGARWLHGAVCTSRPGVACGRKAARPTTPGLDKRSQP
jgi:hypothetical protein